MFADRAEAGRLLAARTEELQLEYPIVYALPRGGVPVGAEVARLLGAPLDVAFVRKIGAPGQPELAVAAVAGASEAPEIVLNAELVQGLALSEEFILQSAARELAVIERQRDQYQAARPRLAAKGRAAIVVDDGVATGMTMQAALRYLRRQDPARLVAATPVAAPEAASMLAQEADATVLLSVPRRFGSVGAFYRSFAQVSDAEVIGLLQICNEQPSSG